MVGHVGKYQAISLDNPNVTLQTTTSLSPATLLPDGEGSSDFQHEYLEVINKVYSSRPDLLDQPVREPDCEFYRDGSSFMENGQQ